MVRRILSFAAVIGFLGGAVYVDGPPAAHTGGFGEPTCEACHFGAPLDAPGGALTLEGLPAAYVAGEAYPLTISLHRPEMGLGGFQLSARFEDGAQAGSMQPVDVNTKVTEAESGVQYIHHSFLGVTLTRPDTTRWTVVWQAPSEASRPVLFHAAANAANGDNSPFDDHIYLQRATSHGADQE